MNNLCNLLKGGTGIGSIELLEVMPLEGDEVQVLIKTIIQVAVGLITIWTMLRKKKNK